MVKELLYVPFILVSIPCLIFVISILLFLFFSASAGTYNSVTRCYSVHISRVTSVLHDINSLYTVVEYAT